MRQLKQKDVKEIRECILEKQDGLCAIMGTPLHPSDAALDHAHQDSEYHEMTEGQIRGVLHKFANSLEGSMRAKYRRSGLAQMITFEEFLLGLYNYLMSDGYPLLHPSFEPRPRKLMKQSYNKLKREVAQANKYLKREIKFPPYPKSKRLTKRLKELYEQFGIFPEYYVK